MAPHTLPPFLGPLHAVLEIDYTQLTALAQGQTSYSVSLPALPPLARLAGFSFGERAVAFAAATTLIWTATVSLDGAPLLTSELDIATLPSPTGGLLTPSYFGQPIGNNVFQLSISVPSAEPGTEASAAPGLNVATAGHIDAHLFYFVERGAL